MEKPYYDKNFLEIQAGDLLKIFHFKTRRKTHYIYKIAVLNGNNWEGKEYHEDGNKGHYRLLSTANKETRVISNAKIIYKRDWQNEDRLKKEARKRRNELGKSK